MADPFVRRKADEADLKRRYPLYVQFGLALSLLLLVAAFTADFRSGESFVLVVEDPEMIWLEDIVTTRITQPPPPPKPPAPIEVDNEAIEIDVTIEIDPTLNFRDAVIPPPLPPPPTDDEDDGEMPIGEIFEVVEQEPQLIGGLEGLQRRVQYPEMARRVGIQGTVFVQFVVDEQGNVVDPVCVRAPGGGLCEAALEAVKDAKFEPGRQRGRPVKVRSSIPVHFRLR